MKYEFNLNSNLMIFRLYINIKYSIGLLPNFKKKNESNNVRPLLTLSKPPLNYFNILWNSDQCGCEINQ